MPRAAGTAGDVAALLSQSWPGPAGATDTPVHRRIERWLAELIASGQLGVGDRLPPEADLAGALGVSRMTLRQALSALADRGVVRRVPGRAGGTFVAEPTLECDITGLAGFTEQLRRGNVRAGARVVSARRLDPGRAVARALELARREEAFEVVRVRSAHRRPLALERSYLPADLFPGLLDKRLTGSLYARMAADYGLAPQSATEHLEPYVADECVAELLEVAPGSALLQIERIAAAASGRPVEYALDLFRPDRIRITVRTAAGGTPPGRPTGVEAPQAAVLPPVTAASVASPVGSGG